MPEVLEWRRVERPDVVARSLARALRQGAVMAFPTESAYVVSASAMVPQAVERVQHLVGAQPIEVALASSEAVRDWLPTLTATGLRLIRRCWPGPLTLACADDWPTGLAQRLLGEVRDAITPEKILYLRQPAHEAIHQVSRRLREPLIIANLPEGDSETYQLRRVLDRAGSRIDLAIDGLPRYHQPATVVEVVGERWKVRRPGVLTEEMLQKQLTTVVLLVCTGNTCRSPMAEALCKKLLAERLGCTIEELPRRGYQILSAGLSAGPGLPAAEEAVSLMRAWGADLTRHQSQQLTVELVQRADHLLVMTRGHAQALLRQLPPGCVAPRLLSPDGKDVEDPIGGSAEVYEACARQMRDYLEQFLDQLLGGGQSLTQA